MASCRRGCRQAQPVTTAARTAQAMRANPLLAAPVQAAVAISAAAALLAAFGFCVSVAASARARRSQRALLGALGMTPAAQARLFCLEELLLSVPAAAVGLAVGIGLAHLLVPALTLAPMPACPFRRCSSGSDLVGGRPSAGSRGHTSARGRGERAAAA